MPATAGALAPRCRPRSPPLAGAHCGRAGLGTLEGPCRALPGSHRHSPSCRERPVPLPEPHVRRSLPWHSRRAPAIGVGPSLGGARAGIASSPRSKARAPRALSPPTPAPPAFGLTAPGRSRALPLVRGAQTPWGWARLPTYRTRRGRSLQPLPGRAVKQEMGISGSHQLSTFADLTSPVTPGSSHACSHTHTHAHTHAPAPAAGPRPNPQHTAKERAKRRGGGGKSRE